ncbi:MAG: alpha/beta fold hydrolase [Hyphomicrobiaceae bacterium]
MIIRFGECVIDTGTYEVRLDGRAVPVEPQVFDLLVLLAANAHRVVTKDEIIERVWQGRSISDATLSSRIRSVRKCIGDDGDAQTLIRTIQRRGFRFIGPVEIEGDGGVEVGPDASLASNNGVAVAHGSVLGRRCQTMNADIRYCHTPDGVRIAYARVGQGPPLVKAGNWLNHLDYDWVSPIWGHVYRGLAQSYSFLHYDARGNGLSDWDVDELSLDAWVRDLETVVDATGFERFPLLGISQGCAISVAYAVRNPERVSHLILYGGYSLGMKKRSAEGREQREAITTLIRSGWGQNNPAFRKMFTELMIPDAAHNMKDFFNELQRKTTSPDCAARYFDVTGDLDVTGMVGNIKAPTLVMHARDEIICPLEEGRRLADGIPGARFVVLPGRNHLFLEHEPAARQFFDEIRHFLGH